MSGPAIVLAEPDVMTRTGLRVALTAAGLTVLADAADEGAALAAVARHGPELVLVSTALPGDGMELVRRVTALHPAARTVVLTARPSGDELLSAVLAGAVGYLDTHAGQDRLPQTLRQVAAGEVALPRRHSERLLDELRGRRTRHAAVLARASAPITDREWEVLELLAAGASSAEMARRLGISEVTVRRHASSVVAKLGVPDRAAAASLLAERSAE